MAARPVLAAIHRSIRGGAAVFSLGRRITTAPGQSDTLLRGLRPGGPVGKTRPRLRVDHPASFPSPTPLAPGPTKVAADKAGKKRGVP